MKTAAALSLLLASASAFAPPSTHMRSAPSTAMFADEEPAVEAEPAAEPEPEPEPEPVAVAAPTSMAAELTIDEAFGIGIETGNKCTPLGRMLLQDASPDGIKWFQNAEIKHGRIAMVATIGFWVQKLGVHFPLYLGPSGSNGFNPDSSASNWLISTTTGVSFQDIAQAAPLDAINMVPAQGWFQIFLAAGWFESIAYQRQWVENRSVPGDYGFDPLGFTKKEGGIEGDGFKSMRLREIKNGRLAM